MVSLTLLPRHLLLMVSAASVWSYDYYAYYGGSVTFTPKGQKSDGTFEVELRNKQITFYCHDSGYSCYYGDCGSQTQTTGTVIGDHYYDDDWCQYEMVTVRNLNSNLPFAIRYPATYDATISQGYWIGNLRGYPAIWKMMAHVDLGTRSDTGQSNRPPVISTVPVLRIPQNCPRSINLTVFDPDGDRVRCRVPTDPSAYECGLCGLTNTFSLDQNSCSLTYTHSIGIGYYPIELMVEDFPKKYITLSYSDGSYTSKQPFSVGRRKREIPSTTTFPTTNTEGSINTTKGINNRTAEPTTTTPPLTTTVEPITTTFPTTTAAVTITDPRTLQLTTTVPYPTSIAPLSKLPLQFSVYVDWMLAPSCLEGDYIPIFLSPTPSNGINLPVFVNHTFEINVRSSAQYSTIRDLIVTGPGGISKQRISTEEFTIKWTPTENDLNDLFSICFLSEAYDNADHFHLYHSDLRCVTADVGHHAAIVTCNETTIKVEVEKDNLIRRNENNLHLNDFTDPSCDLAKLSNSTHVVAEMSLNACGTVIEENQDNIIFKNKITCADTNQIISRKQDVEITISCAFPKRTNLTLGFRHKSPYASTDKGFGTFTFEFEFFESQRFLRQIDARRYPVEVDLKQMMFMQIKATTSIPNVQLFVESCRATPYDNPNSRISYTIIENGCVKDNTVRIYPSSKSQFRFGMEAFEFIGAQEEVYIICSVIMCETGVPGTRCSQGCIPSNYRRKREAAAQTGRHSISQGPLRLVTASDSQASGLSMNLGINLIFIVGCLLVCGVVVYRAKRSKVKYQLLPTSDYD